MSGVIAGIPITGGTTTGKWTRGLSAYDIAVQNGFQGTVTEWLESLKGSSVTVESITETEDGVTIVLADSNGEHEINLPNGRKAEFRYSDRAIQWRYVGDEEWIELVRIEDGSLQDRDVEFVYEDSIIKWKYSDVDDWTVLADLTRLENKEIEFNYSNNKIKWRYVGETDWVEIADLADLVNKEVEFDYTDNILSWRYVGESDWTQIADLTELVNEDKDVVFTYVDNVIKWKYSTEDTWNVLADLSSIYNEASSKNIEFNYDNYVIYWRYTDSEEWNVIADLSNFNNKDIEFDYVDNVLKWKYTSDDNWNDLVDLSDCINKNIEFSYIDNVLMWKYTDAQTWNNFADLSDLVNKNIEFNYADNIIKWKYTDEETWNNLADLSELEDKVELVESLPENPVSGVLYTLKTTENNITKYALYTYDESIGKLVLISQPVSSEENYNETPVSNAIGETEEECVDVSELNYGVYTLSGYYKTSTDGEVNSTEDNYVTLEVLKDSSTGAKTAKYTSIIDGEEYTTIIIYNDDGTVASEETKKVGTQYWESF